MARRSSENVAVMLSTLQVGWTSAGCAGTSWAGGNVYPPLDA
jgi:hypothetical protein